MKLQLLYFGVLLLILVLETFYRDILFEKSLDWIKDIQKLRTEMGLEVAKGLSLLDDIGLYHATCILVFTIDSKRSKAFYYLLVVSTSLFVKNIGKMAYASPRPYLEDIEILPLNCSSDMEYGNPSGHSL